MKSNDICSHCPEVENMMRGNLPFITRHGITIVVLILAIVVAVILLSKGTSQQLMRDILEYTISQIVSKI